MGIRAEFAFVNEQHMMVDLCVKCGYCCTRAVCAHYFVAMCAGMHHNMSKNGYGIKLFPKEWSPATIKKVLDITAIISICDFVDAWKNRNTKYRGSKGNNLRKILYEKYPEDKEIIDCCLN